MISVKNLCYMYQQGTPFEQPALENISFDINDGEFVSVIGHTGSGKSTLIQHLNGLIKPTSGEIYIDGVNICDKNTDMRIIRSKVGLVFQYPEYQLFEETVYKDIAFGPKNMGLSDEEIKERVHHAVKLVGMNEEILTKSPFELSGGQKRRVAIAGVLSMNPEVLILDEPTAGLDPHGRDEILGEIKRMHREKENMTVILVSHSMEDVARLAQRVLVLNSGRLVMDDTVAEVFSRGEELEKIGLSVPGITKLTAELIKRGVNLRPDIYTVEFAKEVYKELLGKGGQGR